MRDNVIINSFNAVKEDVTKLRKNLLDLNNFLKDFKENFDEEFDDFRREMGESINLIKEELSNKLEETDSYKKKFEKLNSDFKVKTKLINEVNDIREKNLNLKLEFDNVLNKLKLTETNLDDLNKNIKNDSSKNKTLFDDILESKESLFNYKVEDLNVKVKNIEKNFNNSLKDLDLNFNDKINKLDSNLNKLNLKFDKVSKGVNEINKSSYKKILENSRNIEKIMKK